MSQAGITAVTDDILPPDVPITFITDSGTATAIGHVMYVQGGSGASTSAPGDSNVILVSVASTGFTWSIVTSADNPVTLEPEHGYIAKGATPVDFILPAAATPGDTYWIKGYGNLWTLAQNAAQSITLGIVTSTPGVGGNIVATQVKDTIQVICVTTNTEFEVLDCIGNPAIN